MFAHCVVPWRRAGTTGSRAGCWPSLRPSSSRPRGTASVTRCVAAPIARAPAARRTSLPPGCPRRGRAPGIRAPGIVTRASAASQAPSEGRESRSGSGTSTSNAYINKELLPAEFGRFYWLTYFGNYAGVYGVARNLWLAASPRAYYVASTLGFTMWPRFNRVTYHILRWPILVVVYAFVFVELLFYCALRLFVAFAEFAVATPKHRELRHALRATPGTTRPGSPARARSTRRRASPSGRATSGRRATTGPSSRA